MDERLESIGGGARRADAADQSVHVLALAQLGEEPGPVGLDLHVASLQNRADVG